MLVCEMPCLSSLLYGLQGQLDYLSYPERLLVRDIVPGMFNATMMLRCDEWVGQGKEPGQPLALQGRSSVGTLRASDHTGKCVTLI